MKNKRLGWLLLLLCTTTWMAAADFSRGGIKYTSTSTTQAKVVGFEAELAGNVEIPSTVDDYTISSIEKYAFRGNKKITSVTIPTSVSSVGIYAFANCPALRSVDNQSKCTMVSSFTFQNCTALRTVSFPSSVTQIGESAFENCSSLATVELPMRLRIIGTHAFKKAGLKELRLPPTVTNLGTWSFEANKDLTYVELPTAATSIAEGAFFDCSALRHIVIPSNIRTINNNVFNGCLSLESVFFMGTTAMVQVFSFKDCSAALKLYVKQSALANFKKLNYEASRVTTDYIWRAKKDSVLWSCPFDADFSGAEGLRAYVVNNYVPETGSIILKKVSAAPAGTAVMLKAEVGSYYTMHLCETTPADVNNLLEAVKSEFTTLQTKFDGPLAAGTQSQLELSMSTTRAFYSPGDTVELTVAGTVPQNAVIQITSGGDLIETIRDWDGKRASWKAPYNDFRGYLASVVTQKNADISDSKDTVFATIGIDVSSDWTRYPRYGFLSDFGSNKTSSQIRTEVNFLNRCHINGVQFYDWHNKHHWPLGGTRTRLLASYKDIANRTISTMTLKNYIARLHSVGTKCMMYNLCYGVLDDAAADGVDSKWNIYTDAATTHQDCHELLGNWKSSIFLVNPGNAEWQKYLGDRNDDVYVNLDFDGFHIDQLGWRGTVYDYQGKEVDITSGFSSFIRAMKERHPDKDVVMNSVSNHGQKSITTASGLGFCYHEMWSMEANFQDFQKIISSNYDYSGQRLNSVFAAYMNYDKAAQAGTFNTAGVLLTDAVIFALGGAHLELSGDHMLCSEYFPKNSLQMSATLSQSITHYYDFLTAYEHLLRNGGHETTVDVTSNTADVTFNAWPPQMGSVTTYGKDMEHARTIHLLNFRKANSLSWRDLDGTMPTPDELSNLEIKFYNPEKAARVWVASPDYLGGAPQALTFEQKNDSIVCCVPNLKYWTMLVVDYQSGFENADDNNRLCTYSLLEDGFQRGFQQKYENGDVVLRLPYSEVPASQEGLNVKYQGADGIHNIVAPNDIEAGERLYDLRGFQIKKPENNIYIYKGKKYAGKKAATL